MSRTDRPGKPGAVAAMSRRLKPRHCCSSAGRGRALRPRMNRTHATAIARAGSGGERRGFDLPRNRTGASMSYLAPSEFVTKMVDSGESKVFMSTRDTVIRAYMAGAILALAAWFAVTITVNTGQPLVGAL